jgi:hypothetical protein
MFASQEVLKMTISADFTKLNTATRLEAISPAEVDPDGDGALKPVKAEVHARGKSRFRDCGFRPFSIKFEKKQKGNVFEHLGKSVKISTHCGDREGMPELLKAPSIAEYEQRVRMEHAIYQLLDKLETASLKTRLVELTYHDTAKDTRETYLGFVREPEDEAAQRCGMLEGEDIPPGTYALNERANLLLFLINNFVIQADVEKNKFDMVDVERGLRAQAPYDFDLLGVFRREYVRLKGRTLDDNAKAFTEWLRRNNSSELQEEVSLMLARKTALRAAFEAVDLSEANLALFNEWFDKYMAVLEGFAACKGAADDADRPACHVPDDLADTWQEAELAELGGGRAMVEPPADADVIALDLPAGKLITFAAPTELKVLSVLDAEGKLVHELTGYPALFSFKPAKDARYYLKLSRSPSLVCSDMWRSDPSYDSVAWAVYEDDYGSTVELAAPIRAGQVKRGAWERDSSDNLFDEDWFSVDSADLGALRIELEGDGSGLAESFLRTDGVEKPVATIDLYPGEPLDLSPLFPTPGEYVVRVIQSYGAVSYELTAE